MDIMNDPEAYSYEYEEQRKLLAMLFRDIQRGQVIKATKSMYFYKDRKLVLVKTSR